MNRCEELELAISLRSAGALGGAEAADLEAHLERCPSCRAEAARADEVLALVALPPVDDAERRALHDLPARTLGALHASERRVGLGKRVAAGALVAAALAAVVLAPALLGRSWRAPAPEQAAVQAEAEWEAPDLDALWEDARVVELDASASAGDAADAALAALDF